MTLHHRLDGPPAAPAVVLLHALATTLEMWEPQVDRLARAHRVVRVDLRGHGRSPAPPGPYTVAELGRDVATLLDRLALARTHVVGISLGGAVAMWLAAHAPARVDRLVLACTSARFGTPDGWRSRAHDVRANGTTPLADASLARWFTAGFRREHADAAAAFAAMLAATPREGYAGCCEALAAWDFRAELGRIAAPTLVVAGGDDPATPVADARLLAGGIRGAELLVLPGARHLASVERPDEVADAVLRHLAGAGARTEVA